MEHLAAEMILGVQFVGVVIIVGVGAQVHPWPGVVNLGTVVETLLRGCGGLHKILPGTGDRR